MPISSIVKVSSDRQVLNLLSDVCAGIGFYPATGSTTGFKQSKWGYFALNAMVNLKCEILECVCKSFHSLGNSNC